MVEGVCKDKAVKNGPVEIKQADGTFKTKRMNNLAGKIAGLAEKGHLSQRHATVLHEHRFLGNDALHSMEKPEASQLKAAIEVIEHTFENIYDLDMRQQAIRGVRARIRSGQSQ